MRNRLYPFFVTASILAASVLSIYGMIGLHSVYRMVLPDVSVLRTKYPVPVKKVDSKIIYAFQTRKPVNWVSLKEIPRSVVAAIILSEDGTFFQHHGYSAEAINAALEYNAKAGTKIKRGGSTITQQVVKNLFLTPEKTISRKIRELLLSVEMERKFPKARILETYINIAEWGPGVYGIEQASERYFHKPAANLTPKDAAVLAFMLPNPGKYQYSIQKGDSPRGDGLSEFAAKRVELILERMWKTGYISAEEYSSSTTPTIVPSTLYSLPQDELPSSL